jgi:hypothetical protein
MTCPNEPAEGRSYQGKTATVLTRARRITQDFIRRVGGLSELLGGSPDDEDGIRCVRRSRSASRGGVATPVDQYRPQLLQCSGGGR